MDADQAGLFCGVCRIPPARIVVGMKAVEAAPATPARLGPRGRPPATFLDRTLTMTITAFEPSPDGGKALARDGGFSAGDLLMVSVLLRLRPSGLLNESPGLAAQLAVNAAS